MLLGSELGCVRHGLLRLLGSRVLSGATSQPSTWTRRLGCLSKLGTLCLLQTALLLECRRARALATSQRLHAPQRLLLGTEGCGLPAGCRLLECAQSLLLALELGGVGGLGKLLHATHPALATERLLRLGSLSVRSVYWRWHGLTPLLLGVG